MTVPILWGEDYQQAYELMVSRHLKKGTTVQFGGTPHVVTAIPVQKTFNANLLQPGTYHMAVFIKAKLHHINKRKKREKKKRQKNSKHIVQVNKDVHIWPDHSYNMEIEGPLAESSEWFLEWSLIPALQDGLFMAPNTLFLLENPWIPIANLHMHQKSQERGSHWHSSQAKWDIWPTLRPQGPRGENGESH